MIRPAYMDTFQEQLNIGSSGSLLKASPVCCMVTIRDVQPGCLSTIWLICTKISAVIPANCDMTKTYGMDCCCLTILFKDTPFLLVSGNVRGSSTNSVSASGDFALKPTKPIAPGKKSLKNYYQLCKTFHSIVVRGRSPFSTPQQADANVGTKRATISCNLISPPVRQKVGFSERSI
jgi:hypothetical protein